MKNENKPIIETIHAKHIFSQEELRICYNGGLDDYHMSKGEWRGSIECRGEGQSEIVAWVYGPTLKIMRERKWAIVEALRALV